jgi:hypothetical protein
MMKKWLVMSITGSLAAAAAGAVLLPMAFSQPASGEPQDPLAVLHLWRTSAGGSAEASR